MNGIWEWRPPSTRPSPVIVDLTPVRLLASHCLCKSHVVRVLIELPTLLHFFFFVLKHSSARSTQSKQHAVAFLSKWKTKQDDEFFKIMSARQVVCLPYRLWQTAQQLAPIEKSWLPRGRAWEISFSSPSQSRWSLLWPIARARAVLRASIFWSRIEPAEEFVCEVYNRTQPHVAVGVYETPTDWQPRSMLNDSRIYIYIYPVLARDQHRQSIEYILFR